ncbi:SLBB domain-containing protein [Novosphingobium sp.]|uniref:polysaccharide biosynthesis/export family protein n=1 Tax=Novosphingobium sp. TaxID=1874826 RepID=UPI003340D8B6
MTEPLSHTDFPPRTGDRHARVALCTGLIALALGLCGLSPAAATAQTAGMAQGPTGAITPVPVMAGNGAAADYQIGAGDLLSISVYRAQDIGGMVRTAKDGSVIVPGVGAIALDGLTASEAGALIAGEIKRRGILLNPEVTVLVSEVRAHVIQVMGEVGRPGSIPLDAHSMMLSTVLARAGAPIGTGAGNVVVIHPDGTRERFLMADLVSGNADRPARSGEVLVVAAAGVVYLSGEVGRPGAYPIEKDMTVGQALALAGGFTPNASRSNIKVTHKRVDGEKTVVARADPGSSVEPGDLVMVGRRVF